jgi:curved DNA-binding protein
MVHKDYYKILGLNNNASTDEVRKAYRKLAMQYHPDRNRGKEEWANDKFKEINEAFNVLCNPEKREKYDYYGSVGNIGDIFDSPATRTTFKDLINDFNTAGLGFDFLDDIFGNDFRGRRNFRFHSFKRGLDRTVDTRFKEQGAIDFEDLFEYSPSCKESSVNYEIVLNKEQALKGIEKELVRKGKTLKVTIPAGVMMGSRIRLKNALKTTDGQPGDIFISIKVI